MAREHEVPVSISVKCTLDCIFADADAKCSRAGRSLSERTNNSVLHIAKGQTDHPSAVSGTDLETE